MPCRILLRGMIACLGLPRLLSWMRSSPRLARGVAMLARRAGGNCLEESLAEISLFSSDRQSAALAIGVKKDGGKLLAHAWVERPGESVEVREGHRKLGTL